MSCGRPTQVAEHNRYQRHYYETRELPRMTPISSPYVLQHLERLLSVARLSRDARLLEVGAGLGRYTLPLLEQGFTVTALDLSPVLLDKLRLEASAYDVRTVACDIAEVAEHVDERFSQAVGFFTLHHMHDLDLVMRELARVLTPGARVAFCEPNALNPLFYVQIVVTPGMTWRGDGGVVRMRPRVVLGAMERAGFGELGVERFGLFPPFIFNRRWGRRLEQWLDPVLPVRWLRTFQIFHGTLER
ncbi:MAG: class I SAM-dependent methyltransferase [Acidobacteriia bacterium]|nr:class I SAM-dependent methyltransferase [Terriglobia bacterium]